MSDCIIFVKHRKISAQTRFWMPSEARNESHLPWPRSFLSAPSSPISAAVPPGGEGAALQLGGTIGSQIGGLFHLDEKDQHILIMCGMSAVFAALFGTPLTATFFAMEVISIGVIYYAGLVPCIISSPDCLWRVRILWRGTGSFLPVPVPVPTVWSIFQVIGLSALCALLSIVFCLAMHKTHHYLQKWLPNSYLRAFCGGIAIILLTLLLGNTAYNGAGMDVITAAIGGSAGQKLLR